jgi:hypothetical protein
LASSDGKGRATSAAAAAAVEATAVAKPIPRTPLAGVAAALLESKVSVTDGDGPSSSHSIELKSTPYVMEI